MIGTITLNPALDRRYTIDELALNVVKRTSNYSVTAGGKGLNVSRVLTLLGEKVSAFGFLGGDEGNQIRKVLDDLGILSYFITISESTRNCLNIMDLNGNNIEVLEKGPIIKEHEIEQFMTLFKNHISYLDVVTLSGSLPAGVPTQIYGKLIKICNENGIQSILDTSKEALLENLQYEPYLIKPNKEEVEYATNLKITDENDIRLAGKRLLNLGAKNVAISLGSDGMYFIGELGEYRVSIPQVNVINPVGSGDSAIAGFAYGFSKNKDIESILKLANACGISNAMEEETGYIDINTVHTLLNSVGVKSLIQR